MQRGQLTLIVLVGIMVLFAFGFLLAVRHSITSKTLGSEADQAIQGYLQSTAVTQYVSSCIDRITEEGLYLLGRQGGVVYEAQKGWTVDGVEGTNHLALIAPLALPNGTSDLNNVWKVQYGIRRQENANCADIIIPDYPYAGTPLDRAASSYIGRMNAPSSLCPGRQNVLGGPFGVFSLPALCDTNGPNSVTISQESFHSCYIGTYAEQGSIQEEFADYITRELASCVDFTPFADLNGNLIEVQDSPNVTLILAPDDFTVKATYPIKVSIAGKEPITQLVDFPFTKNIRLKRLYDLAAFMISQENTKVAFGMNEAREHADDNITVTRIRDPCTTCSNGAEHDDVIEIKDFSSQVHGEPFTLRFAVEDRSPALEYMHFPQGNILPQYYDIVVLENKAVRLEPEGYDPEEENAGTPGYRMTETYAYSGWKADYEQRNGFSERWQWSGVSGSADFQEPKDIREIDDMSDIRYEDHTTCLTGPGCNVVGNLWETSAPFTDSSNPDTHRRVAEYLTDDEDKGPHEVKITIRKESGLIDYQLIRILVADLCAAGRYFIDPFIGMDPSIEDPYILESCSVTPFSEWTYRWHDPLEGDLGEGMALVFDKTIADPLNYPFRIIGPRTIELEVITPTESSITTLDLDVKACTPYRAAGDPYPYNPGNGGDPFLTNHLCCTDEGELRTGEECYRYEGMNCYRPQGSAALAPADIAVQDAGGKKLVPAGVTTTINAPQGLSTSQMENDIFQREYAQECGDRGNACSGEISDTLEHAVTCADLTAGQEERCEGPVRSPDQCDAATDNCYPYAPGETFEKTYQGSGTGYCNSEQACSSQPGVGGYDTGGKLTCTGQCDGQGGCTYAADCQCIVGGSCGAECDPTQPYAWTGTQCASTCDYGQCTFSDTSTICRNPTNNPLYSGSASCRLNEYCQLDMRCTPNGVQQDAAVYCPSPGYEYENAHTGNERVCYYNALNLPQQQWCDANGCRLAREEFDVASMAQGKGWGDIRSLQIPFVRGCYHNCDMTCTDTGYQTRLNTCLFDLTDYHSPTFCVNGYTCGPSGMTSCW